MLPANFPCHSLASAIWCRRITRKCGSPRSWPDDDRRNRCVRGGPRGRTVVGAAAPSRRDSEVRVHFATAHDERQMRLVADVYSAGLAGNGDVRGLSPRRDRSANALWTAGIAGYWTDGRLGGARNHRAGGMRGPERAMAAGSAASDLGARPEQIGKRRVGKEWRL